MKKLLLIILTILTASSAGAWIFPDSYDTKTKTVYPAQMTFETIKKTGTYYSTGTNLHEDFVNIDAGTMNVYKATDGLFIGDFYKGKYLVSSNVALSLPEQWMYYPIKRISITYHPFAQYNSATIEGCQYKELQKFNNNGKEYIKKTFEFDLPVQVITLASDNVGDWDYTSDLAKELGGIRGVIITEITIDFVFDNSEPMKQAVQYCKELQDAKDISPLKDRVTTSQTTSSRLRYNATSQGDVNMDSKVNSTDVVTIYNKIINGTGTTTYDGHEYVDLGLPSGKLWATCNLGADTPEGYGDYFAWADKKGSLMTGKSSFTVSTYSPHVRADLTNNDGTLGISDQYFPQYTTPPYSNTWSRWRIPLERDFQDLIDNCTSEIKISNGVLGTLFTSKINNNTIFFPYTGKIDGTSYDVFGGYWSCAARTPGKASALYFWLNGDAPCVKDIDRYTGNPIRCVISKKQIE